MNCYCEKRSCPKEMVPLEFNVSLNGVGGFEVFLSKDALRGNRSTDLKKKNY